MLFALGAASSAVDLLKTLMSPKSSPAQSAGSTRDAANLFDLTSGLPASAGPGAGSGSTGSGRSQISPETMSALLAAQGQSTAGSSPATSRSDALKDLFSQIDADGDGEITRSEFDDALGAGGTNLAQADDVFSRLDTDRGGSVSLDEMASALKPGKGHHHRHLAGSGGAGDAGGSNADPLMQALDGASSTSVTNSDGSTTTTLTYADGSKVTMTRAASATAAATSSYNFVEQLIARQAEVI
jgi:hypothetical protein